MNREGAETFLRLLAETEIRGPMTPALRMPRSGDAPAGSTSKLMVTAARTGGSGRDRAPAARTAEFSGELQLLSYAHVASGAVFAMSWTIRHSAAPYTAVRAHPRMLTWQFTITDDRGQRYELDAAGEAAPVSADVAWLRPDPPPDIRWLEFSAPGTSPVRVELAATAGAEPEVLSPLSPVPGWLATGSAHDDFAATTVALPELDGIRLVLLGLHTTDGVTSLHALASGLNPDARAGPRDIEMYFPLSVWIRDSGGRWHAVLPSGWHRAGPEYALQLRLVPPLPRSATWIELLAAGRSAQVRARLTLRWGDSP